MSQSPSYTPKAYLMVNKLLFSALFMGVLIITIVFFALVPNPKLNTDFSTGDYTMIVPLVAFAGLSMSKGLFMRMINQAKNKETLKGKLNTYRTALIIGLALCEAPAIFANVAYFVEGNQFYQLIAIVCLGMMLTFNPKQKKLIKDLELRGQDLEQFMDRESKIGG